MIFEYKKLDSHLEQLLVTLNFSIQSVVHVNFWSKNPTTGCKPSAGISNYQ